MRKLRYKLPLIILIILFFIVVIAEFFIYFYVFEPDRKKNSLKSVSSIRTDNKSPSVKTEIQNDRSKLPIDSVNTRVSLTFARALGYAIIESEIPDTFRHASVAVGESENSSLFAIKYALNALQNENSHSLSWALSNAMKAKRKYAAYHDVKALAQYYVETTEHQAIDDVSREMFGKDVSNLTLSEMIRFAAYYPEKKDNVRGFDNDYMDKCRNILKMLNIDGTISDVDRAMCMDDFG